MVRSGARLNQRSTRRWPRRMFRIRRLTEITLI